MRLDFLFCFKAASLKAMFLGLTACVALGCGGKGKKDWGEGPDLPQVSNLKERRDKLVPLLESAEQEKASLVAKLREAGVSKSSDLKNNPAAQRLASALQKVSGNIKNLQTEIARVDEALALTVSLERLNEQKKVAVSDEELSALAVASNQDLPPTANDPAHLEAILSKELGSKKRTDPSDARAKQLVGKWLAEPGDREQYVVEFAPWGIVTGTKSHSYTDGSRSNFVETGRYSLDGSTLIITEVGSRGKTIQREVEFLTNNELLVTKPTEGGFYSLYGRLRRIK